MLPTLSPDAGARLVISIVVRFPELEREHADELTRILVSDPDLVCRRDAIIDSAKAPAPAGPTIVFVAPPNGDEVRPGAATTIEATITDPQDVASAEPAER